MIVGASFTFMFTFCVASGLTPLAQVTVKEKAPEAVGTPPSTPLEALSERPAGIEPAVTVHVNVDGLPDAWKECE